MKTHSMICTLLAALLIVPTCTLATQDQQETGRPYVATLHSECVQLILPAAHYGRLCRLVDKSIDRYSLFIFEYGQRELDEFNRRILAEYIVPDIREKSKIKVTGYCDAGERDEDGSLTRGRANNVADALRNALKRRKMEIVSLTTEGVGSSQPLFSNNLPEGRFYNRTVQIVVESPRKEPGK